MLSVQIMLNDISEHNKEEYLLDLRACGVQRLFIGFCEIFEVGEERVRIFSHLKNCIAYFEEAGFEVGVWVNTLGWGGPRGSAFNARFSDSIRITNFAGKTAVAVCPLDKPFTDEMCRFISDIVRAGAGLILLDDDLVLSVRPGFTCACPLHISEFCRRAGKPFTREELPDLFTGIPTPMRRLYMNLMGDTTKDFCRKLRNAADAATGVRPVRMGLCLSYTHFDLEGVDIREVALVLSGGEKPLLRLSGAPYWSCFSSRYEKQSLLGVAEFVRMQAGFLADGSIELLDENDPHPRRHTVVPAALVECYDKISIAGGSVGRLKYILNYGSRRDIGDTAYIDAHLENLQNDKALSSMFEGKKAIGFRVYETEHKINEAHLPDTYMGDKKLMIDYTHPFAGIFLAENNLPTAYEGGGAGIVFGENARHLAAKQLGEGLILDAVAARILHERGIDVGFQSVEKVAAPVSEYFPYKDRTCPIFDPDGAFYRFELCASARELSSFESAEGVFPACYFYKNAHGQRFAVYAFDALTLRYYLSNNKGGTVISNGRHEQLYTLYEMLSGYPLPVRAPNAPGLYVLEASKNNRLSVLLCNVYPDKVYSPKLELNSAYRIVSHINCAAVIHGTELRLSTLPPYGFTAIELEKN